MDVLQHLVVRNRAVKLELRIWTNQYGNLLGWSYSKAWIGKVAIGTNSQLGCLLVTNHVLNSNHNGERIVISPIGGELLEISVVQVVLRLQSVVKIKQVDGLVELQSLALQVNTLDTIGILNCSRNGERSSSLGLNVIRKQFNRWILVINC